MMETKTVTLKEAQFRLQCGRDHLRREIERGEIAVYRINARVVRVDELSLRQYQYSRMILGRSTRTPPNSRKSS